MISDTAKQLASLYLQNENADLEGELAKIASDQNLNAQVIERIVNRTNRNIIVGLQKEAVQGDHDPHFVFPTIKTANVLAVLKSPKPSAVPSVPVSDARPVLPPIDVPEPPKDEMGLALTALSILKNKLAEKKSKLARIEIALEAMMRKFEKCAAHELLKGTPVEVFEQLPIDSSPIISQLEDWGHKLASLNEDFDVDEDHPVVKLAHEIAALEGSVDEAARELEEVQQEIAQAREKVREHAK